MPRKRTIVVTGVSKGLGRALAMEFAATGHTVVGCGRSEAALESLGKSLGKPHDFQVVNVTHDDQVGQWAQAVIRQFGPPDLLINNAAVINANDVLWRISPPEFSFVLDTNVKGVYFVIRHFVPAMIAAGRGTIVNFSSGWGRTTSPEVAPYCASKWAIEGLTQALAHELPAGMAAVPVNPGIIDTAMLRSCFGSAAAAYPKPDQWAAQAAKFLLKLGPKDNGQPRSVMD